MSGLTLGSRSEDWSPLSDCIRGSTGKNKNLSSALSERQPCRRREDLPVTRRLLVPNPPNFLIPDKLSGTQRGWNCLRRERAQQSTLRQDSE